MVTACFYFVNFATRTPASAADAAEIERWMRRRSKTDPSPTSFILSPPIDRMYLSCDVDLEAKRKNYRELFCVVLCTTVVLERLPTSLRIRPLSGTENTAAQVLSTKNV